jgi:hypothetical protein
MIICFVCGEPIDEDTPHWCHEEGCPNEDKYYGSDSSFGPCDCDLYAHPECCPRCKKEGK